MYDTEIGFPGLIIDGTACSRGEGELLSVSELYDDIVAENAQHDRGPRSERDASECFEHARNQRTVDVVRVYSAYRVRIRLTVNTKGDSQYKYTRQAN